jgi:hypothetical protein
MLESIKKRIQNLNSWKMLCLSILLVGLVARISVITIDIFHFDEYYYMIGVDKSFSEYTESNRFWLPHPINVHYWLSYRVFGNELLGYRLMPLISSLAVILIIYYAIPKFWPSAFNVCFFTLLVLTFNRHSLGLVTYSMFIYANSLLLSCLLFLLFLRLSTGGLTRKQWVLITIIIIPSAFFSTIPILVPVATGIFSVILFRFWRSPSPRNLKSVWFSLWEMKPLLIFPLIIISIWVIYFHVLAGKDSYMASAFFTHSTYPQNFFGVLQFAFDNTRMLFKQLLLPYGVYRIVYANIDKMIFAGLIGISAIFVIMTTAIQLAKKNLDPKIAFTLIFIFITFLAILTGGILGQFPFGPSRYSFFLLIPIAVLIGYSVSMVFDWVFARMKMFDKLKVIPVIVALVIFVCGIYIDVYWYKAHLKINSQNNLVVESIRNSNVDLILLSSSLESFLKLKIQDQYSKVYPMGWGAFNSTDGNVPESVEKILSGNDKLKPVKRILVVSLGEDFFIENYPSWYRLVSKYFIKNSAIEAPSIRASYWEIKR